MMVIKIRIDKVGPRQDKRLSRFKDLSWCLFLSLSAYRLIITELVTGVTGLTALNFYLVDRSLEG